MHDLQTDVQGAHLGQRCEAVLIHGVERKRSEGKPHHLRIKIMFKGSLIVPHHDEYYRVSATSRAMYFKLT